MGASFQSYSERKRQKNRPELPGRKKRTRTARGTAHPRKRNDSRGEVRPKRNPSPRPMEISNGGGIIPSAVKSLHHGQGFLLRGGYPKKGTALFFCRNPGDNPRSRENHSTKRGACQEKISEREQPRKKREPAKRRFARPRQARPRRLCYCYLVIESNEAFRQSGQREPTFNRREQPRKERRPAKRRFAGMNLLFLKKKKQKNF